METGISKRNTNSPIVLTIAGLDPSGGAGIVADVKTISAFGCSAAAAVTSLTFQNTTGVFGSSDQTPDTVRRQIEPVIRDLTIAAIKTGMLPSADVIETVAHLIKEHNLTMPVVDPVIRSTSGYDLIDEDALRALIVELFPLSCLITPNIPEAERITGMKLLSDDDMHDAARKMRKMGAKNVLIKGGHRPGKFAVDMLFAGENVRVFSTPRIEKNATHGTGCALSSAIAANLALGNGLEESISIAKKFVTEAIRTAP